MNNFFIRLSRFRSAGRGEPAAGGEGGRKGRDPMDVLGTAGKGPPVVHSRTRYTICPVDSHEGLSTTGPTQSVSPVRTPVLLTARRDLRPLDHKQR